MKTKKRTNCSSCLNWRCSSLNCDFLDCCENHGVSEIDVTVPLDVRVDLCVVLERQQHSRRGCDRCPRPRSWGAGRPCGRAFDPVRIGVCVWAYDPLWKPWQARRLSERWLLERRAAVLQEARRSHHRAARRVETCEASVDRVARVRHRRNRPRHRVPGVLSFGPSCLSSGCSSGFLCPLHGRKLKHGRRVDPCFWGCGSILGDVAQQSLQPY